MNEIISVKQLSKSYGGLTAVQGLDLSVTQGRFSGCLERTVQEKALRLNVC